MKNCVTLKGEIRIFTSRVKMALENLAKFRVTMIKTKRTYLIPLWIIIFLILMNLVSFRINGFTIRVYEYGSTNTEFIFMCIPAKGRDLDMMLAWKTKYNEQNNADIIICRKFRKNYFLIWNWYDYMVNRYYDFPLCR